MYVDLSESQLSRTQQWLGYVSCASLRLFSPFSGGSLFRANAERATSISTDSRPREGNVSSAVKDTSLVVNNREWNTALTRVVPCPSGSDMFFLKILSLYLRIWTFSLRIAGLHLAILSLYLAILTFFIVNIQSPFQGKSVHSAAIFATPPGSSNKTKSNLNEWGNPEISKTARWTRD